MFSMVLGKTFHNHLNGLAPSRFLKSWQGGTGTEAATTATLAGAGVAAQVAAGAGTMMLFGSPPGWAALITVGVLAVGGILASGYKNEKANTIQILPLTRYGRPWIGGLEGYQVPSPPRTQHPRARGGGPEPLLPQARFPGRLTA